MIGGYRAISRARHATYVCNSCQAGAEPVFESRRHGEQRRGISRNYVHKVKTAEEEWELRAQDIRSGKKMSVLDLLEKRGYVNQIVGTREDLNNLMIDRRVGVYCGVDPTAPSLHIGHMVPFMVLGWLYIHGYTAHFLLGGATAKIGDPTDRLSARASIASSTRKANMAAMHMQLKRLGALIERYAERRGYIKEWSWRRALVNNTDWWSKTPLMDFMQTAGKAARIGPMLGRDTVKNRLEKGDGMSFSEFSYPLIQAYDWWQLFQKGVQIQVGGADQFGNILAGAEVVKHIVKNNPLPLEQQSNEHGAVVSTPKEVKKGVSNEPMGFTVPLLTTAAGEKFGKSAGNAVWLDSDMTSSYDLYQFFLRSADADVEKYLKLFTFIPLSEISETMKEHQKDESKRVAQHKLARDFVELVHGREAAEKAEQEHRQMFKKDLSIDEIRSTIQDLPGDFSHSKHPAAMNPSLNKHAPRATLERNLSNHVQLPRSLVDQQPLSRILWSARLVASRSEGQRLINNGGVHVGARTDKKGTMEDSLTFHPAATGSSAEMDDYIIDHDILILRLGKWKMKVIKIIADKEYDAAGLFCPGWDRVRAGIEAKSETINNHE